MLSEVVLLIAQTTDLQTCERADRPRSNGCSDFDRCTFLALLDGDGRPTVATLRGGAAESARDGNGTLPLAQASPAPVMCRPADALD